jgi:polyphosphate kinase 2 (PPK2 family)
VLSKTSTDWAPWYIIPANRKWYRNLIISTVIIQTLESLDMHFPEPDFDPADIKIT